MKSTLCLALIVEAQFGFQVRVGSLWQNNLWSFEKASLIGLEICNEDKEKCLCFKEN